MKDITMYMVTHKPMDNIPNGRTPIMVGGGNNEGGYLMDNTGDNIAIKNANFCELTAIYWIWKNDKTSAFVSIEHYRRFLMKPYCIYPKILTPEGLMRWLKDNDVILSKRVVYGMSLLEYYRRWHYESDLELVREAIGKNSPEYLENYDQFINHNECSMFNIMAIKKAEYDKYCEWLFEILSFVESRVDLSKRTNYQKRVYGFLAERLLNVWVIHNRLKVKELPVYYLQDCKVKSFLVTTKRRMPRVVTPSVPRR